MAFAAFTACEDQDDDNNGNNPKEHFRIKVTGLTGVDEVTEVRAMTLYAGNRFPEKITVADLVNGKFTIDLPVLIAADQLETITPTVLNLPEGITMTPASLQGIIADFWGYNANNELIGSFVMLESGNVMAAVARYYYTDRPATITGTHIDRHGNKWVYDATFSEGWNLVYQTQESAFARDAEMQITTTMSTKNIMDEEWFFLKS